MTDGRNATNGSFSIDDRRAPLRVAPARYRRRTHPRS
jgi:hypothetical protein